MKKLSVLIVLFLISMSLYAQLENSDSLNTNTIMVLDSVIVDDMKLLIANDRLYSKNGLIDALTNQASKEKAESGKIEKGAATQTFIDNINADYDKYLKRFVRVDTLYIDSVDLRININAILTWQQSVLNDPEIKNATSLQVWEQNEKELKKLRALRRQLSISLRNNETN